VVSFDRRHIFSGSAMSDGRFGWIDRRRNIVSSEG